MAGIKFTTTSGQVTTGTAAKTILQIVAAANHRVHITKWSISFEGGTASNVPVQVDLVRQTTAGTMSAGTVTKKNASDDETLQTTSQHTATVEPTGTVIVDSIFVPAYQGGFIWRRRDDDELPVAGGGQLGIRVTATDAVDCIVTVDGEE